MHGKFNGLFRISVIYSRVPSFLAFNEDQDHLNTHKLDNISRTVFAQLADFCSFFRGNNIKEMTDNRPLPVSLKFEIALKSNVVFSSVGSRVDWDEPRAHVRVSVCVCELKTLGADQRRSGRGVPDLCTFIFVGFYGTLFSPLWCVYWWANSRNVFPAWNKREFVQKTNNENIFFFVYLKFQPFFTWKKIKLYHWWLNWNLYFEFVKILN